ncbi:hypothetical protein [Candidatus Magnetobacterium casense]|uniref:Uncharacterized protein n=1 Tax=Candidatus Magnetobacterium casense TaxID=1455061 RepID=A0ABS6RZ23_9BACT|nr:hypothetical protein [Candidatus Magnetobacterium casensis]MBV6341899.1 hypothetical protein [Candidatus Magnetobacterium casensis]
MPPPQDGEELQLYLRGKLKQVKNKISKGEGDVLKKVYEIEHDLINALIGGIARQHEGRAEETLHDRIFWEGVFGSFDKNIGKLMEISAQQNALEDTVPMDSCDQQETEDLLSLDNSDLLSTSNRADVLMSEVESGKTSDSAAENIAVLKEEVIVLMGYGDTVKGVIRKLQTIKELNDRLYVQNKNRAEKSKNLQAILTDYNRSNQELQVYIRVLENAFTELQEKVKDLKITKKPSSTR